MFKKSVAQAISRNVILVDFFEVFYFPTQQNVWGEAELLRQLGGNWCAMHTNERTNERYIGFKDETPQWPDTLVSSRRPHLFVFVLSFRECGALYTLLPQSRLEKISFQNKPGFGGVLHTTSSISRTQLVIFYSVKLTRIFIDSTLAGYVNSIAIINLIKAESTWMRRDCYRY